MKKNLVFVALLGFVMTFLCGCGPKSVKGVDGKEYDSYQSACRNQDFVAAYDWIEKNNGSEEDKDYVFNAEMLYLTSLGTEEASNRIIYLLAEYQIPGTPVQNETGYWDSGDIDNRSEAKKYVEGVMRFNKRCDNVLDMAITQNNKKLIENIIKLYKQDIKSREGISYPNTPYISVESFTWESRDAAQAKYDEAFGEEKEEVVEEKVQSAPKESKKKRRR